jgi:hypothetical protein
MARIAERLGTYLVSRKEAGDHASVTLISAVKLCEPAISVSKEAQHRRHAIVGATYPLWGLMTLCCQGIDQHSQMTVGMSQLARRAANMTAVREYLFRQLFFEKPQSEQQAGFVVIKADGRQCNRTCCFQSRQSFGRFARYPRQQA